MSRFNFLYFSLLVILISGAFNFFDYGDLDGSTELHREIASHRWVVAEVRSLEEGAELTAQYASTTWQFLHDGQFIQLSNDVPDLYGEWSMKGSTLELKIEGEPTEKKFIPKRQQRNGLMLKGDKLEIRLLKLSN